MGTCSPEDTAQPSLSSPLIANSTTVAIGSIILRTAFHIESVFPGFQHIDPRKVILADDLSNLEFRLSRYPRCQHFYNAFHFKRPTQLRDPQKGWSVVRNLDGGAEAPAC